MKMVKKKSEGINFRKSTLIGILITIIILGGLYFLMGLENLMKYSLLIIIFSVLLTLLMIIILIFASNNISKKIEPKEEEELLNLKMNQGATFSTLLFGLSIAFIIPGITIKPFTDIVGLILMVGLFFLLLAILIFNLEYLPRLNKLERILKIKDMLKKQNKK